MIWVCARCVIEKAKMYLFGKFLMNTDIALSKMVNE